MAVVKAQKPASECKVRTQSCDLHSMLVKKGGAWLRKQGCGVVISESIQAITLNGERPDVIGWRDSLSILIECKASRADFLQDAKKPFRLNPEEGMGDWRFYLAPQGVIAVEELPPGWGLLIFNGRKIESVHGVPPNCHWWKDKPFEGEKVSETAVLVSALRRYQRIIGRHVVER
jgi:hypothetical protein